jgi:GntR family transcriptional regulator/MocR family aminotransferase
MEVQVNLAGCRDLSGEIYRQIRRAILDGRLRPGQLLPPTRELAQRLSVARTTVTVAYDRLSGEGFVVSRVGAGTFVARRAAPLLQPSKGRQPEGALQPRAIWNSVSISTAFASAAQYDFRTGLPDGSLFPHDKWRPMVTAALRSKAVRSGVYADAAGYWPLREAIARYIGVARGMEIAAEDVVIVNGTQQGLDVVAKTLLSPGDSAVIEDPSYNMVQWLLTSAGVRVKSVQVDNEGLVVAALPSKARFVYVTPSHQYPLGVSMSSDRRRALLEWAGRNRAAIVEDDYDSEFRFQDRPIEPLQTLDASGRVIYIGSFSKTMLPILRLGFVVVPRSLRAAVHAAKSVSDWHTPLPLQIALAQFIEQGEFARHVRKMREVYRTRREIVLQTLSKDFGSNLEVIPSIAGLHVAARAGGTTRAEIRKMLQSASEAGVAVQDWSTSAGSEAGIMLGYGAISTANIREGLRRLRRCLD